MLLLVLLLLAAVPGGPGFLPGPDHDAHGRITASTGFILKLQGRLHPPLSSLLPDTTTPPLGTAAPSGAAPPLLLGSLKPTASTVATPLQLLASRKDATTPPTGPASGGGGRQGTPLAPSLQAWSQQTPQVVSLAAINPSLVPAPSVVAAYQASLRLSNIKGRKRDAPGSGPVSQSLMHANYYYYLPSKQRMAYD